MYDRSKEEQVLLISTLTSFPPDIKMWYVAGELIWIKKNTLAVSTSASLEVIWLIMWSDLSQTWRTGVQFDHILQTLCFYVERHIWRESSFSRKMLNLGWSEAEFRWGGSTSASSHLHYLLIVKVCLASLVKLLKAPQCRSRASYPASPSLTWDTSRLLTVHNM